MKTASIEHFGDSVNAESQNRSKESLLTRFLRWLYPDQRNGNRHQGPPLIAFLGAVRTTVVYPVGDISPAGFYMLTRERWVAGTEMPITLQRTDGGESESITLPATVVRQGKDGIGFVFAISGQKGLESEGTLPGSWATQRDLAQFLSGLRLSQPSEADLQIAS